VSREVGALREVLGFKVWGLGTRFEARGVGALGEVLALVAPNTYHLVQFQSF
jgi:hypothetical protein